MRCDLEITNRRHYLINARKQKGWIQKDVVEKLSDEFDISITESYYGMIEQSVRTPSLDVALSISELFDMEPSKIFLNTNTTFSCVELQC
ncbi:helix-turn-helix transcriptional regulator [Lysinibacillus xylanilyticus]|uniref:helix-turn-helix transcriptional regulator n=1 Tax=Lysinibacillus xylanilyticus TaxID=582475 RepID=UPI001E2C0F15|nr:helix-turn-helix transcriptional regulator [Lysinibacillus xylanilyticus]